MNLPLLAMGEQIGERLKNRGETVGVSESSAGGLISAALLSVPGASKYFLGRRGHLRSARAKRVVLGLPATLPAETRSSSEPYALICAQTIRDKLGTTWGLAETGAAGPSGNRYGDDAGHSCIAVAGPREVVLTIETRSADREANMWMFAKAAIELLGRQLD